MRFSVFVKLLFILALCFSFSHVYAQRNVNTGKGRNDPKLQQPKTDTTKVATDSLGMDSLAVADSSSTVIGKQVADSLIYSPSTVSYITPLDLIEGRALKIYKPDTLIGDIQRYNYIQTNEYQYQFLGNLGTASREIFERPPPNLGKRWSYNQYELYLLPLHNLRFFNTLSPFTNIKLVQGGQKKSDLLIEFARNITPEWGFSLYYKRISASRVVGRSFQKNDEQLNHQTLGANMRYFTPSRKYKLLFSLQYYDVKMKENAGFTIASDYTRMSDLFLVSDAELVERISNVTSNQYARQISIHHQKDISKQNLQVYQTADYSHKYQNYKDDAFQSNKEYYYKTYFDLTQAKEVLLHSWKQLNHEAGLNGSFGDFSYRAGVRTQWYSARWKYLKDSVKVDSTVRMNFAADHSLIGYLSWLPDSSMNFTAKASAMLDGQFISEVALKSKNICAKVYAQRYEPTHLQSYIPGNHFKWNYIDSLKYTTVSGLELSAHKDISSMYIDFGVHARQFASYYYFDTLAISQVALGTIRALDVQLKWGFKAGPWEGYAQAAWHTNDSLQLMPIPTWTARAGFRHIKRLFNNQMEGAIGVDAYYRSAYYAPYYMPAIQQFYNQQEYKIGNYPIVDVYASFKVKTLRAFLKVHNLGMDVFAPGYHDTPYYMGQPRSFEVGVFWMFFD